MTKTVHGLRAANTARQAEWDADSRIDLTYRANELAGEVGEACNVAKKLARERLGIAGSRATVQDLADELADVVICADLVALTEGIDLDAAVERKFNLTSEKVGLTTRLSLGAVVKSPVRFAASEADALATIRGAVFGRLISTMPRPTYDHLEQAVDEVMVALKDPMISWVFETLYTSAARQASEVTA